jgi:dephospho-CoA kinase
MGCGKSTAAKRFEHRGFRRLDADALIREQIHPSEEFRNAVRERYGASLMGADGQVDRKALAAKVFADDAERKWLEEITHPGVFAAWRTALAADPKGLWAIETPLLYEGGLEIWFDFTLCVACAPDQQLARLEQRGLDRSLAAQRISKQLPLTRKIEWADFVLWNEGSLESLHDQIDRLISTLPIPA